MTEEEKYILLRDFCSDMAEDDCPYYNTQPCTSVHPSKLSHGVCDGCKARIVLKEIGFVPWHEDLGLKYEYYSE